MTLLSAERDRRRRPADPETCGCRGRNDPIFGPDGALAFAADAPGAEICLLDGGHFLLESHLDAVADRIRPFLNRTLP